MTKAKKKTAKKKPPPKKVHLGDRVKDSITGFKGIAVARSEYLYGCTSYCVSPEALHEGKTITGHWFDEPRLVVMRAGVHELDTRSIAGLGKPGGPRPVPSGRHG